MDADIEIAQRLTQIQNMIVLAAEAERVLQPACVADLGRLIRMANEARQEHLRTGESAKTLASLEQLDDALEALDEEAASHGEPPIVTTLMDARTEVRDLRRQITNTLNHHR